MEMSTEVLGSFQTCSPITSPTNSSGIWVHHASSTLSWAIPASSPLSRLHFFPGYFHKKGPSWCFLGFNWLDVSHGVSTWARFPLSPHFSLCQVAKSGTSPPMSSSSLPPKALATLEKSQVPWWLLGPPKNSNNSSLSEAGLNCSGQHLINRLPLTNQTELLGAKFPSKSFFVSAAKNPCRAQKHTILSGILSTHLFSPKIDPCNPQVNPLAGLPLWQGLFGPFSQLNTLDTLFCWVRNHQVNPIGGFGVNEPSRFVRGPSQNALARRKPSNIPFHWKSSQQLTTDLGDLFRGLVPLIWSWLLWSPEQLAHMIPIANVLPGE